MLLGIFSAQTFSSNWWPNQLNLQSLRQNMHSQSPHNSDYNYSKSFAQLDLHAVIADLKQVMTDSKPWWPADYGTYAPFFIRMTWHAAGTYRISDGRGGAEGGMQRFAPLNSWPDNTNLDKARRLLWPIKQKYGNQLSWSDLMVLAGNVAMESMGFKTIGFAGGREDAWEPEFVDWGQEQQWLASHRHHHGKLDKPYAATQMGLIYVNPEGPNGNPDPLAAAKDIRVTFGRMAMNDEETVALIAGGHAFGKAHGAGNSKFLGPAPEGAPIEQQGLGWKSSYKTGKGADTITSGLEGAWTSTPTRWSHTYLKNLFQYDWVQIKSSGGAIQWMPKDDSTHHLVPDAHLANHYHPPMMFTTDLALKFDPAYRKIALNFLNNPKYFEDTFAKAWFKLIHRDMGPKSRYLGPLVPKEVFIWQDPVPEANTARLEKPDLEQLKSKILSSNLTPSEMVQVAWASASVFRATDKRGGANGARIRLLPQANWPVNEPEQLNHILAKLASIQKSFNQAHQGQKTVSMADLIVLAGNTGVEQAASKAGVHLELPFHSGRTDATQAMTDISSFAVLEPTADGFRNYYDDKNTRSPQALLIEKAGLLNLTIPEMTVLIGGLRVLNVNYHHRQEGVFTHQPGVLNNDFFINLLDNQLTWKKDNQAYHYQGIDSNGKVQWQATAVDLVFGANAELRAIAEFYAENHAKEKFIHDFAKAWNKVMELDRFDLR